VLAGFEGHLSRLLQGDDAPATSVKQVLIGHSSRNNVVLYACKLTQEREGGCDILHTKRHRPMKDRASDTDRTGWAKAVVPLNWTDDTEYEDNEWTECEPPAQSDSEAESGLNLDSDKVAEAEEEAGRVAEMCGL